MADEGDSFLAPGNEAVVVAQHDRYHFRAKRLGFAPDSRSPGGRSQFKLLQPEQLVYDSHVRHRTLTRP